MKNILLLFLLITFIPCFAQDATISRLNIKTAPLQWIVPSLRTWNVSAEYFLDKQMKSSITINPYLIYWNERSGDTTMGGRFANHRGVGAILSYKYYFFGFTPKNSSVQKGGYISSFVQPEYLSVDFVNVKSAFSIRYMDGSVATGRENGRNVQDIISLQTGIMFGYQWLWWNRVVFDIYGGIGYRYAQFSLKDDISAGIYYPITQFGMDKFFDKAYTGLLPKVGFQIGVAF
jgi:hypothetical protein